MLQDVRDLLEETPDESTRHWMLEVLNVLVDLLPQERQLQESDGGYMSEVLDEFAELIRQKPQHYTFRKYYADALALAGRYEEAIAVLEEYNSNYYQIP